MVLVARAVISCSKLEYRSLPAYAELDDGSDCDARGTTVIGGNEIFLHRGEAAQRRARRVNILEGGKVWERNKILPKLVNRSPSSWRRLMFC
jgi:hypothetical protein